MNSTPILPIASQIVAVRDRLICTLIELSLSHAEIRSLNLCSVRNGSGLSIQGEGGCSFITLTGEGKHHLNAWQIIRPRGNPKSEALFITLRGKYAGQRISMPCLRRIGRQAGKPLNIRFAEHSDHPNDKQERATQNQPSLRMIRGGRQ